MVPFSVVSISTKRENAVYNTNLLVHQIPIATNSLQRFPNSNIPVRSTIAPVDM